MKLPVQITYRHMEPSPALEDNIRERAAKLDRYVDNIMSCRVMIEAPHKHQRKGKIYHVRIDISLPGHELAVSRDPEEHQSHADVYVAVRDAFDAARRQLEDLTRRRRGDVKTHEPMPHGRICELEPGMDFGRIATLDGREVYFHRNSVINAEFDTLEVGDEVWFDEESGDHGPQASSVRLAGKHHPVG
jgi:ribosomal subunit interface protein